MLSPVSFKEICNFEIAKKLKEKGFVCDLPFAMYNELGQFALLTTSAPIRKAESCYTYRDYYDYEDFDENDFIAPTIAQVLKWLREEKNIHVSSVLWYKGWYVDIQSFTKEIDEERVRYDVYNEFQSIDYETYEESVIAAIEYVLNNLI
jgi:hypothetical protein